MEEIRINKFLAQYGLCSRREADQWIAGQRVKVNGQLARPGTKVIASDLIEVDGKAIQKKTIELPPPPVGRQAPNLSSADGIQKVYFALNKPKGIICTTDRREKHNIIDYLDFPVRIFPIGRLDKDSSGLLLLTNDGDIVNKILRAHGQHEKEYVVTVNRPIPDEVLDEMTRGVPILDTVTLPCQIKRVNGKTFNITLIQGLNRQIRRMCEYFGYTVESLQRVRIMNISLGSLKAGQWRYLSQAELGQLTDLLEREN